MSTKLTLTLDKIVLDEAKAFAKAQGKSLSQLIENYLKSLPKESELENLSPNTKKIAGSVKFPENFDYKKELTDSLSDKYLSK